ncbi:YdcF family protein [Nocardioides sp. NPDC059952]|uniref:YdcF family protein n=1 Tax=Nocardioides sp. NPDC059952 TaxID=3347014 RepID=UPI003655C67B
MPRSAILVEPRATSTGQNIALSRELLAEHDIDVSSATLSSRPYQQRRAYATAKRVWPGLDIVCSARSQELETYIKSIGSEKRVLDMLVGDTQRLWVYAEKGIATPQEVDEQTRAAYERLVEAGYTSRLVAESV